MRRLGAVLVLLAAFMVVEVVAGVLADSVALLADAAHMLVDVVAVGLSLVAMRLARRPAGGSLTFGLHRVEILAAAANGLTLVVLAGLVVYEAVGRLRDPADVGGAVVLGVAAAGALVNVVALVVLHGADRGRLNIEGSYQHVLMDLLGSLAALAAGVVILVTGADRADAVAALAVAALMLRSAWRLIGAAGRVLLEAAPSGVDADEVGRAMAAHPGVLQVHDLHVWEVTSGFPALAAHVVVATAHDCHAVTRSLEAMIAARFGIDHTTLQTEHAPPRLHPVGRGGPSPRTRAGGDPPAPPA